MPPTPNAIEDFAGYSHLTDQPIEQAGEDQLADVARPSPSTSATITKSSATCRNRGCCAISAARGPRETLPSRVGAAALGEKPSRLLPDGVRGLVSALAEVTDIQREYDKAH